MVNRSRPTRHPRKCEGVIQKAQLRPRMETLQSPDIPATQSFISNRQSKNTPRLKFAPSGSTSDSTRLLSLPATKTTVLACPQESRDVWRPSSPTCMADSPPECGNIQKGFRSTAKKTPGELHTQAASRASMYKRFQRACRARRPGTQYSGESMIQKTRRTRSPSLSLATDNWK